MTPFMSLSEINIQLTQLVRNERKITHEILTYMNLFETCAGHLKMGYASMHQYLTKHLGYSDDQAFRRLKAARLLREVPEVSRRIQEGSLNLSQAAQAQKAFDLVKRTKSAEAPLSEETKKSVIAAIENKNNFETQQILATQLDLPTKTEEHTRPQADRSVRLELTLSQEQFEKLKSVKSWLSHQIPSQGTAEVLEYVMDLFLAKKQGVSSKEKSVENSEPKRKAPSPEIRKQASRQESKNQVVSLEPKVETASSGPKKETVTSESKSKTLASESTIEAQPVKPSSAQATPYGGIPLTKTTSAAASLSALGEGPGHARTGAVEMGHCRNAESMKIVEPQVLDVVRVFNKTDRADRSDRADRRGTFLTDEAVRINKSDETFITWDSRRQCGKDFVQNSQSKVQDNSQNHSTNKSENNSQSNPNKNPWLTAEERSEGNSVKTTTETKLKVTAPTMTIPTKTIPTVTRPSHPLHFGANLSKTASRYITIKTKQEVWRRAGGCCEHRNADGERCQSRYQLQFDHIRAHAIGGSNGSDNLQLFCRTHNLWKATQEGIGLDSTPLLSLLAN